MITGLYGEQKHEFLEENEDDFIEERMKNYNSHREIRILEYSSDEDEALIQEYRDSY